jgi:hypothetical protein
MSSTESTDKLSRLQGRSVDLSAVLPEFPADHVHWPRRYQPWYFRMIPQLLSRELPVTDSAVAALYNLYFKLSGLNISYHRGGTFIMLNPDIPTPMEATLKYPWVDFELHAKATEIGYVTPLDLNTTLVDSTKYKINIPALTKTYQELDLNGNSHKLLDTMLEARIWPKS